MTSQIPPVIELTTPRPQPKDVLRDMLRRIGMQSTFKTLSSIAGENAARYRAEKNTYYADCWEDMQREIDDMCNRAPRL